MPAPLELAGYADVEEIGRGRKATVYRARETASGRDVALKVVDVRGVAAETLTEFRTEAAMLAALGSHPNIVTLYGVIHTDDARPVLVQELCAGPVSARAAAAALPPAELVAIGVKIAGALETAHRAGMLHRDVTPHNILLTALGEPALADFGVGRLQSATQSTVGLIDSISPHSAPEVLEGAPTSAATDVYELASTLYEFATGRPAFDRVDGESAASLIRRILSEDPAPIVTAGVPAQLSRVLLGAMAKDPAARPAGAAALAAALGAVEVAEGWARTPLLLREPSTSDASAEPSTGSSAGSAPPAPASERTERRPRVPVSELTVPRPPEPPVVPPEPAGDSATRVHPVPDFGATIRRPPAPPTGPPVARPRAAGPADPAPAPPPPPAPTARHAAVEPSAPEQHPDVPVSPTGATADWIEVPAFAHDAQDAYDAYDAHDAHDAHDGADDATTVERQVPDWAQTSADARAQPSVVYPIPPSGSTPEQAAPPDVPTWAARPGMPALPVAPQFIGDLSLDPAALRPKLTVRAGLAAVTVDHRRLTVRQGLQRRRFAWPQVLWFDEKPDDVGGSAPMGRLVAVTSEGPVELAATRRGLPELRHVHAILDAYRVRAQKGPLGR